jgi:hypothetical protein
LNLAIHEAGVIPAELEHLGGNPAYYLAQKFLLLFSYFQNTQD